MSGKYVNSIRYLNIMSELIIFLNKMGDFKDKFIWTDPYEDISGYKIYSVVHTIYDGPILIGLLAFDVPENLI
jgi:hypothetical protein